MRRQWCRHRNAVRTRCMASKASDLPLSFSLFPGFLAADWLAECFIQANRISRYKEPYLPESRGAQPARGWRRGGYSHSCGCAGCCRRGAFPSRRSPPPSSAHPSPPASSTHEWLAPSALFPPNTAKVSALAWCCCLGSSLFSFPHRRFVWLPSCLTPLAESGLGLSFAASTPEIRAACFSTRSVRLLFARGDSLLAHFVLLVACYCPYVLLQLATDTKKPAEVPGVVLSSALRTSAWEQVRFCCELLM